MKAIILAAGTSRKDCGFPFNALPKCLYRYKGEIPLERSIRIFNQCGIKDVRIVTGYRTNLIEQFLRQKKLQAELIFNPDWKTDGLKSLILGVENIQDDILLTYADEWIVLDHVQKLMKSTSPLAWLKYDEPWGKGMDNYYRGDIALYILKIGKKVIPYCCNVYAYKDKYASRYEKSVCNSAGVAIGYATLGIFHDSGFPVEEVFVKKNEIDDLDYYYQTDEYVQKTFIEKIAHRMTHEIARKFFFQSLFL